MSTDGFALFDLAEQRLAWLDRRQGVLAQNIANANTPRYVAQDLQPFASVLAGAGVELARTDAGHLTASTGAGGAVRTQPAERAPDGNAVSLDDQLTKVADTDNMQSLTMNLYHKYLGLFRTAAGR